MKNVLVSFSSHLASRERHCVYRPKFLFEFCLYYFLILQWQRNRLKDENKATTHEQGSYKKTLI